MDVQVLKEKLQQAEMPRFHSVALRLSLADETYIAAAQEGTSLQHSTVSIGSYPVRFTMLLLALRTILPRQEGSHGIKQSALSQ